MAMVKSQLLSRSSLSSTVFGVIPYETILLAICSFIASFYELVNCLFDCCLLLRPCHQVIGILPYEPLGPDELEPAEPRMGQIENRPAKIARIDTFAQLTTLQK